MKSSTQKNNHLGGGVRSALKRIFRKKSKTVSKKSEKKSEKKPEMPQAGGLNLRFWRKSKKSEKKSEKKESEKKDSKKETGSVKKSASLKK